ncbi:protein-glutamine gamma-glutamyltransferase TgpA [Noviherbaspirillum agri]
MNASGISAVIRSLTGRASRPMSRDKADTLLLLTACTLVLFPHIGHLPGWVFPVCAGLLLWRGWITFQGSRMPPRWLLLPLAILAMAGVYATHKTLFGRDAGVAMLTLLLALKLLEMHAKRDLFVVLFLSFFLILASFFYSQSIGSAAITIAAVLVILTTQVSFQYTGKVPPLKQRLRVGAMILGLAVPLTLVLFLLFPRIQGPLWGLPSDAHAGRTGLSDTMAPGNISQLALSDDVAFRVKFPDSAPPQSKLYWRGVVLGNFDGRTWTSLKSSFGRNPPLEVNLRGTPVRYQVTLEPHSRNWVFALEAPQSLPRLADNPTGISSDMQLLSSQPINARVRYEAVSHLEFDLQPNAPKRYLQQWLDLPPGFNPRALALASRLRSESNSNAERINAVLRMFREQNFRYTLEPPPLGRHSVDEFLFDSRAGFCEHYAGSFVVLMRAMGIPSRVVTGYQGGELNTADGFFTVRQSDAHAWTEVWVEGRGWLRVDPTAAVAPSRIERNLSSVIPRQMLGGLVTLDGSRSTWAAAWLKMRQNWDAVNNAWNQWVLNYTPEKQKSFLQSLGFDDVDWRTMTAAMVALGALAMAAGVLPLMLRERRRDPLDALYESFCRSLGRHGLPRAPHEGPRSYAARLTAIGSPLPAQRKAAVARFLERYETVRYGGTGKTPTSAISELKTLLAECR